MSFNSPGPTGRPLPWAGAFHSSKVSDTGTNSPSPGASPLKSVVLSVLENGAGVSHESPRKGGRKLQYRYPQDSERLDQKIESCFSALHKPRKQSPKRSPKKENTPPFPPRRTPPLSTLISPILSQLDQLGTQAAKSSLQRSSSDFFSKLLSQWLLEDLPTQSCLSFLCFSQPEEVEEFVAKYTELRLESDEKMNTEIKHQRLSLENTYGILCTQILLPHTTHLLLSRKNDEVKASIIQILTDSERWIQLILPLPQTLENLLQQKGFSFQAINNLIKEKDDDRLKQVIIELQHILSDNPDDHCRLIGLHLDQNKIKLFRDLVRHAQNPKKQYIALTHLINSTLAEHFIKHSPFLDHLSSLFETIDLSPLIKVISKYLFPESEQLSPSISCLLSEHFLHSYERFRLLPRLYALYANTLALLRKYASSHPLEQIQSLFCELADMGAKRGKVSERYRQTQAHNETPGVHKALIDKCAQEIYLLAGFHPHSKPAEGAHTLPNPGAFSLNSRAVAKAFKKHSISVPSSQKDESIYIDHSTSLIQTLTQNMSQYKKQIITSEDLLEEFQDAFTQLHKDAPEHFIWNAYWTIAEVFLHSFSESEYFPTFVNHEHDSWTENEELSARALHTLSAQALATRPEQVLLTRHDANTALSPLYKEALKKCDRKTQEFYSRFKETGTIFYLINAWMGLHVASTIPR